jgi:hypothetical protein
MGALAVYGRTTREMTRMQHEQPAWSSGRDRRSSPAGTIAKIDQVLAALEARQCHPRQRGPGSWCSWCPGHAGHHPDGLSIKVWPEGGISLHCWSGCPRERIIQALGLDDLFPARGPARPWFRPAAAREPAAPSGLTRADARALVEAAAGRLWTPEGRPALESLRGRGLADPTIRQARLGWTPGVAIPIRDGARYWRVAGVIIPWFDRDRLSRVATRQADGRYREVFRDRPGLYPGVEAIRPGKPLIIAEGPLDCLLLAQELGELASVITLGSVSATRPDPSVLAPMLVAHPWFVATDADTGGDNAARRWLDTRARRIRPPFKDWGDSRQAGVDLRRWWADRLPLEQFLARLQARGIQLDGRLVHPRIAVRTVTGRVTYTGTDPPLQGLARPDRLSRLGPVVDGRVFVRADSGQIEPRILHALLRQRGRIDWEPGPDLYLTLGGNAADRDTLKTAVNALINGGVPPLGATGRLAEFIEAAAAYRAELARQAGVDGFVRTLAGRHVALAAAEPNHPGKAVNRVVQGTAADIFNRAVLRIDASLTAFGLPAAVGFCLFDEVWVETEPATLVRVADLVRREMQAAGRALGIEVPVRLDDATAAALEIAEERAGIMEYDGMLTREAAERAAGLR